MDRRTQRAFDVEANMNAWMPALVANEGYAVDRVAHAAEEGRAAAPPLERWCSECGAARAAHDAHLVAAEEILATTLVAATRFCSAACAQAFYTRALEHGRAHLIPAVLARIDAAFRATRTAAPPRLDVGVLTEDSADGGAAGIDDDDVMLDAIAASEGTTGVENYLNHRFPDRAPAPPGTTLDLGTLVVVDHRLMVSSAAPPPAAFAWM